MIFIYSKFRAAVSCFFIVLSGTGLVYACSRQPVVACADNAGSDVVDDFLQGLDIFLSTGVTFSSTIGGIQVIGLQQFMQLQRGLDSLRLPDYTAPSGSGYIGYYSVYGDSIPRTVYLDSPPAGRGGRSLSWVVAYSQDFRVTATFEGSADIDYYASGYNQNYPYGGFHGAMVGEASGSISLSSDTDFFQPWSLSGSFWAFYIGVTTQYGVPSFNPSGNFIQRGTAIASRDGVTTDLPPVPPDYTVGSPIDYYNWVWLPWVANYCEDNNISWETASQYIAYPDGYTPQQEPTTDPVEPPTLPPMYPLPLPTETTVTILPVTDESGEPVTDESGEPVTETEIDTVYSWGIAQLPDIATGAIDALQLEPPSGAAAGMAALFSAVGDVLTASGLIRYLAFFFSLSVLGTILYFLSRG